MTNEKINALQVAFDLAIRTLTELFEETKAEITRVEKPTFKTEKRLAEIGERILIVNPLERNCMYIDGVYTVARESSQNPGRVDVEEITSTSDFWRFRPSEYEVITEPEQLPFVEDELTPNDQRDEL